MAVAGPLLRTCRAELHNELESQTTARAILDSPSPPLAQSGGETDEWSTQHHGDRSAELHNGAEDLDDEAESFDTNAEGLEMKDVAGRTTPMDGGTSQMPQRIENHPQDTGCATRRWSRYRLKPRSSAFRERCLGLWRKGAARCHITTSGSNRGDRHLGSHDFTKVMPIITGVRGRSKPDIPHVPGPACLVEGRINHSIDEIDDAGESTTIEEYDDGRLHYRQEAERVDPSCGGGEGVIPCTDIHGDGSLEKVGSDDDDSRSEAMVSHDCLDAVFIEIYTDVGFVSTRVAAAGSGRNHTMTIF